MTDTLIARVAPVAGVLTARAIREGVDLLSLNFPGWPDLVNLSYLDLSDCCYCVLGQIVGDYADGVEQLFDDTDEHPRAYGFEVCDSDDYETLTLGWVEAIKFIREQEEARA